MKKTLLLIATVATVFAACKDKEYNFRQDTIYLNGVEQPKFKSTQKQRSLRDIVTDPSVELWFFDKDGRDWSRGFHELQRDTVNMRLMMWSTDILDIDGNLDHMFLEGLDMHLRVANYADEARQQFLYYDTVGYIPHAVLVEATRKIDSLYEIEQYDEIYELFHSAFTFYTCTGEEYKQIVANGGN